VSSARAHPDYLAYFNELAGARPERVLVDSDLDWGQDLRRLTATLQRRGIDTLSVRLFGSADLRRHDLPVFRVLPPYQPATGWIAVSELMLRTSDRFTWLKAYEPVERVGKSIRLYHIPGEAASRASPEAGGRSPGR
jgi:hypothetical protein